MSPSLAPALHAPVSGIARRHPLTRVLVARLLLSTSAAWAQSIPDLLPRLGVPDTRGLRFAADTAVVSATLTLLGGAMPNEGGVCYYGEIALVEGRPTVALRRVAAARGRGKLASFEWAPGSGHGCTNAPDLVGAGHSHPYSTCESEQSALPESRANLDAALLAGDPRLLFSLIWCFGDGRAILMWQHGGREVVEYLDQRFVHLSEGRHKP